MDRPCSRTHLAALAVLLPLVLGPGCKQREICGGRGMIVDTRPLIGTLAQIGVPPGATLCKDQRSTPEGDKFDENHRLVELGKNGDEGFDLWKRHLEGTGWKEVTPLLTATKNAEIVASAHSGKQRSDCSTEHRFTKEGVPGAFNVSLSFCSSVWKEVGWSSVNYLSK